MNRYKRKFIEDSNIPELTDVDLVEKIIEFIKQNPFPKDHEQLHTWAKQQGYEEASIVEQYVYAILTVFVCGGTFNKNGMDSSTFDSEEIQMGKIVEAEHTLNTIDNPVVNKIADYFQTRIAYDHISDNPKYYHDGKEGKLFLEELK